MSGVDVRALQPADAGAARALVSRQLSGTRYEARILEQLEAAIAGDDPECRGVVAITPSEDWVRGLALFGAVAGAQGVAKLHALVAGDSDTLRALEAAVRDASARARMVMCEIAEDAPFRVTVETLRELGYEEAGRVADFVRDGVDLLLLIWRRR